jgi:hypothetical protein
VHRLSTAFVLGYHGCSRSVADRVLGGEPFARSENDYDWLGHGTHFWQANPSRALMFAREKRQREGGTWDTAVVGAIINLGLCLDLATTAGIEHVKTAYKSLVETYRAAGLDMPHNAGGSDLLLRRLDCAVIETLHDIRKSAGETPIETVSGIFVEGHPIYERSGFYEKTHIQICVCNPECIRGVFRVPGAELR